MNKLRPNKRAQCQTDAAQLQQQGGARGRCESSLALNLGYYEGALTFQRSNSKVSPFESGPTMRSSGICCQRKPFDFLRKLFIRQ